MSQISEKGQSPKGSPAPAIKHERSNVSKQPRMPRKKYSTRFRLLTTSLSRFYLLMAGLNLITFSVSIPLAIGDTLAFVLALYGLASCALSVAGAWMVRR